MKLTKLAASFQLLSLYWLTLVSSRILKLPRLTHKGFRVRITITKDHINMTGVIHLMLTLAHCVVIDQQQDSGCTSPLWRVISGSWESFQEFGGINGSNNKN